MDDDRPRPFAEITANKLCVPDRRKRVFQLRDQGLDWPEVAAELGVSVKTAQRDWVVGIMEAGKGLAKIALTEELHRLDDADRRCEELIEANMSMAKIGEKGSVAAVLGSLACQAKNREHRAKYLGLFQPEKVEHSGEIASHVDLKAAQDELLGRISRLAAAASAGSGDSEPNGGGSN